MKITANIATYKPRLDSGSLKQSVESLYRQVDEVRICFNGYSEKDLPQWALTNDKISCFTFDVDLTDNGKFVGLESSFRNTEPEYYFTCDDDLIYPPDYVSKTIEAIEKYGCIIAHHGRQLTGLHRDYYTLHKAFRCLDPVYTNEIIDCCGTGVTAFRTDYFHPKGLAYNPNQRMSDLIFSLEAAKQKKTIGIIEHEGGWIKPILNKESIFETESRTGNKVQNLIANEIYKLNHG